MSDESPRVQRAVDVISGYLDLIREQFKEPRVTLIVRSPDLEDADLVLTDDDPEKAAASMLRLAMTDRQETDE